MEPLSFTTAEITAWIGGFYWPLVRVSGLMAIAPIIGGKQVPVRIRVGLAVLFTLVILPFTGTTPVVEPLSAEGVLITAQQFLIGVAMGFMLQLIFNAVALAGENIAMTMGLGFAVMSDPQNGVQVPVVGQFFMIMATLLFLALNGHHAALEMMAASFDYMPVATIGLGSEVLWQLLEWFGVLFRGAVSIALPAVAALLTVNLVMGVMTKAAPQLNIFSVGFPVTMTVGFVVILVSLPSFLPIFENLLSDTFDVIATLFTGRQ